MAGFKNMTEAIRALHGDDAARAYERRLAADNALAVITDALEELGASDAVAILRDSPLYREHLELAVEIADALRSTRPELTEHRERLRQLRKSYPPSPPGLHRWNRHREALQQLRARLATPPASPPPVR